MQVVLYWLSTFVGCERILYMVQNIKMCELLMFRIDKPMMEDIVEEEEVRDELIVDLYEI